MGARILIVEDEIFVAADLEASLEELGHSSAGIAMDSATAYKIVENLSHSKPDLALVDVNLRDGQTGPVIGKTLSEKYGIKVIFVTANPAQLGDGIPGTLGVISKPVDVKLIQDAIQFALSEEDAQDRKPPSGFMLFRTYSNRIGR